MALPVNRVMLASQLAKSSNTKIDHFPSNIGAQGMLMIFNEYVFERPTSRPLLRLTDQTISGIKQSNGAVLLPIPNNLIDRTDISTTTFNMAGQLGAETVANMTTAASQSGIYNALGQTSSSALNGALGVWNGSSGSGDALYLAKRLFGDNFLLGAVSQGAGMTINPKMSLLFQGVELKDFSFEWTLAPSERDESVTLRNIIKKIKRNVLPWFNPETTFTTAMFRYPSTVDIFLLGVDPDHYMFFKTAMVRDFTVNYTPNGLSVLRGGKPSSVNISIRLQEMDIHTANDYGLTDSAINDIELSRASEENDAPLNVIRN